MATPLGALVRHFQAGLSWREHQDQEDRRKAAELVAEYEGIHDVKELSRMYSQHANDPSAYKAARDEYMKQMASRVADLPEKVRNSALISMRANWLAKSNTHLQ